MNATRKITTLATAGALAVGGLLAGAVDASAGNSCFGGCSKTYDVTRFSVLVARDWCSNSGYSGPCKPRKRYKNKWLPPGTRAHPSHTPLNEDWDAFRVDAGWCYRVSIATPWNRVAKVYNRVGKGALWVRVRNYQGAWVTNQNTTGNC